MKEDLTVVNLGRMHILELQDDKLKEFDGRVEGRLNIRLFDLNTQVLLEVVTYHARAIVKWNQVLSR